MREAKKSPTAAKNPMGRDWKIIATTPPARRTPLITTAFNLSLAVFMKPPASALLISGIGKNEIQPAFPSESAAGNFFDESVG